MREEPWKDASLCGGPERLVGKGGADVPEKPGKEETTDVDNVNKSWRGKQEHEGVQR
jgi:hypothetical protein